MQYHEWKRSRIARFISQARRIAVYRRRTGTRFPRLHRVALMIASALSLTRLADADSEFVPATVCTTREAGPQPIAYPLAAWAQNLGDTATWLYCPLQLSNRLPSRFARRWFVYGDRILPGDDPWVAAFRSVSTDGQFILQSRLHLSNRDGRWAIVGGPLHCPLDGGLQGVSVRVPAQRTLRGFMVEYSSAADTVALDREDSWYSGTTRIEEIYLRVRSSFAQEPLLVDRSLRVEKALARAMQKHGLGQHSYLRTESVLCTAEVCSLVIEHDDEAARLAFLDSLMLLDASANAPELILRSFPELQHTELYLLSTEAAGRRLICGTDVAD